MKIHEFLTAIDLLSPKISLYYKGSNTHSHVLSGLLTVISYLAVIILTIYIFVDFLKKKNPSLYFYNREVNEVGIFPLDPSGIFHFVNFDYEQIDYSSIKIIGYPIPFDDVWDAKLNETEHWIYEKCDNDDITHEVGQLIDSNKDYKQYFSLGACIKKVWNVAKQKYYLSNEKEFYYPSLGYGTLSPKNKLYSIVIKKCKNDLSIFENNCHDEYSVDNYLKQNLNKNFFINIIDHYINVDDYNNPNQKYFYRISNKLEEKYFTQNHYNLKPVEFNTDTGFIFEDINSLDFTLYEKIDRYSNEQFSSGILAVVQFWLNNKQDIYKRSYSRIQTFLGQISGINTTIINIAYIINFIFNDYICYFDFYQLNKENKIQNNFGKKIRAEVDNETEKREKLSYKSNNFFNDKKNSRIVQDKFGISREKIININNNQIFISNDVYFKLKIARKLGFFEYFYVLYLNCSKTKKLLNEKIKTLMKLRMTILSEEVLMNYYLNSQYININNNVNKSNDVDNLISKQNENIKNNNNNLIQKNTNYK